MKLAIGLLITFLLSCNSNVESTTESNQRWNLGYGHNRTPGGWIAIPRDTTHDYFYMIDSNDGSVYKCRVSGVLVYYTQLEFIEE